MVLPAPTAAEGQAAETEWLSELRRWLHLGRKGVIIMIRPAQLARVREFALMLESVEPESRFEYRAERLLETPERGLVALALRDADLDWLNLNRPIISQKALRVVLWAEAEVAERSKFRSPDLHDWISHFVTCPPGVPEFARRALRRALQRKESSTWRGPGLHEALVSAGMTKTTRARSTLPGQIEGEVWVAEGRAEVIVFSALTSAEQVQTVMDASAQDLVILANPEIRGPEWPEIDSQQLPLEQAAITLEQAGVRAPAKVAALAESRPALIDAIRRLRPGSGNSEEFVLAPETLIHAAEVLESLLDPDGSSLRVALSLDKIVEEILGMVEHADSSLPAHLNMIATAVEENLGVGPLGMRFRRVLGLAYAIQGDLESATEHLSAAHQAWLVEHSPMLSGVGSELAAVLYLRGRYTEALDKFDTPIGDLANHVFAATAQALGGAEMPDTVRGSYDDVIAFLRVRLREIPTL